MVRTTMSKLMFLEPQRKEERLNALDCGSRVHQFESGTPTIMVPWCNGSTSDFLSENEGSTPLGTVSGEMAERLNAAAC